MPSGSMPATGRAPSRVARMFERILQHPAAPAKYFGGSSCGRPGVQDTHATALEVTADPSSEAHYIMMTDGSGATDLIVPGGMFRNRFPEDRAQYYLHMDGGHIFDFTRNRVPPLINELLTLAGKVPQDYAYFVFHQANEYLIKFLANKAGISLTQVPFSIAEFGNTGAASVPLTLALAGPPAVPSDGYNVMLLGFGVGLSWGGVSLRIPRQCMLAHFVYVGDVNKSH